MAAKAIKPDPSDKSIPSAAAVCVYPSLVGPIKEKVMHSDVKVASVSSYFPSGQVLMESKLLDTNMQLIQVQMKLILLSMKAFWKEIIEKFMMKLLP